MAKDEAGKINEILEAIPQREPFLFVDEIIEINDNQIKTKRTLREDEAFFKGHFPGDPVMPGVLICEAMFQTGAILLKKAIALGEEGTPAVTRIQNGKFKRFIRPGETLEIEVKLIEKLGSAYFLKGIVRIEGKFVASVEFGCTLVK